MMTNRKTDIVSNDSAGSGDQHHQGEMELTRRSEVPGDQKNCFTRYRQTRILKHHTKEHGPVAISEHVLLDQLKRVMQEIHCEQLYRIRAVQSNQKQVGDQEQGNPC